MKSEKSIRSPEEEEKEVQGSKSYIYMAKGLSDELSDDVGSAAGNAYRNAFFENDKDLDDYHKQVKDALAAQLQKELNITSHIEIKRQYEGWVANYSQ